MALTLFERWWRLRNSARACFERGLWRREDGALTVDGTRILAHLKEFCRASETCVVIGNDGRYDTHGTAVAEGRREVMLRILTLLQMTDEELMRLKGPDDD